MAAAVDRVHGRAVEGEREGDPLLNPKHHDRPYLDERSRQIIRQTINFFENKGLAKVKADEHARTWHGDLPQFDQQEKIFAALLTPLASHHPPSAWGPFG